MDLLAESRPGVARKRQPGGRGLGRAQRRNVEIAVRGEKREFGAVRQLHPAAVRHHVIGGEKHMGADVKSGAARRSRRFGRREPRRLRREEILERPGAAEFRQRPPHQRLEGAAHRHLPLGRRAPDRARKQEMHQGCVRLRACDIERRPAITVRERKRLEAPPVLELPGAPAPVRAILRLKRSGLRVGPPRRAVPGRREACVEIMREQGERPLLRPPALAAVLILRRAEHRLGQGNREIEVRQVAHPPAVGLDLSQQGNHQRRDLHIARRAAELAPRVSRQRRRALRGPAAVDGAVEPALEGKGRLQHPALIGAERARLEPPRSRLRPASDRRRGLHRRGRNRRKHQ